MTGPEQDTAARPPEQAAEMAERASTGTCPVPEVPRKSGFDVHRERMQDRQGKLDAHRTGVVRGIAGLNAQLDKAFDTVKRLNLRAKIQVFEGQLAAIAEEQASLDREKEHLARVERLAQIEGFLATRIAAQAAGADVAGKIRQTVNVLASLMGQWHELQEIDRKAKDSMRDGTGQVPPNNLPTYEWATGVDQNFVGAIGQVVSECHRMERRLQERMVARGATA